MPGLAGPGGGAPLWRKALPVLAVLLGLSVSIDTESLFPLLHGGETASEIVHRSHDFERMVAANDALESEVEYLKTPAGGKWAVYRYLGLVEPGQQAGRLVDAPDAPPHKLTQPERMRNLVRGLETRGTEAAHVAWEVWQCYSGLRPMDQPPPKRNPAAGTVSKQPAGLLGRAKASAQASAGT